MRPLVFRGNEATTGRTVLEHTPTEADSLAHFINELVFVRNPAMIAAMVEARGGRWVKPKVRFIAGETQQGMYLIALAEQWFYPNVRPVVWTVEGCRPVLTAELV